MNNARFGKGEHSTKGRRQIKRSSSAIPRGSSFRLSMFPEAFVQNQSPLGELVGFGRKLNRKFSHLSRLHTAGLQSKQGCKDKVAGIFAPCSRMDFQGHQTNCAKWLQTLNCGQMAPEHLQCRMEYVMGEVYPMRGQECIQHRECHASAQLETQVLGIIPIGDRFNAR